MNQILSVEMPKNKQKSYRSKGSKKADIRTIIIFFCIIMILFAAIILLIFVPKISKGNEQSQNQTQTPVITGTQPSINVEVQSETALNIIVTHDKQISSITYNWNNGESTEEKDIGETTKEIQVEIPAGTNTLNISVTDINGVTKTYSEQHTGVQGPDISIDRQGNQIKLIVQSDKTLSYISYNWNGGEEKQIEINDVKTEQLLDVSEGTHVLNVVAVDSEGRESTEKFDIIGDNKPTLKITRDSNNLYIEASDDEGLKNITILVYNGETQEFEINDKQFNKTLPLQQGDNRFIITVYNINGIKNEQKARVVK